MVTSTLKNINKRKFFKKKITSTGTGTNGSICSIVVSSNYEKETQNENWK